MTDPLRVAAQRLFDAALDSGFPPEEIDPESSYAQRVTLRGRDLDDLRAALAADAARPVGRNVQDVQDDQPELDAAWAAVEAALPEGWERVAVTRYRHFPAYSRWVADLEDDRPRLDHPIRTYGSTPDEALRALATRLTEDRP